MEPRRNQFPLPPPLLETIAFPRNRVSTQSHRGGPTDQPTDRRTQSLIEVLFAPKKVRITVDTLGPTVHTTQNILPYLTSPWIRDAFVVSCFVAW
jgi:hypothetical protein